MKKFFSLFLTFLLLLSFTGCTDNSAPYKVGICAYTDHSAQSEVIRGFKDFLTEKLGDEISFDEQSAANDMSTASTIINTFTARKVDLILADNTQALQIAANSTFDIPVLGAAITDYKTALGRDTDGVNVSGTSDIAPLDLQAEMFIELLPHVKTVGLVYCSSEANSLYQINSVQEHLADMGILTKEYSFSDSNDLSLTLEKAVSEVEAIYLPTDNTLASCIGMVDVICRSEKIPVITGEMGLCKGAGIATLSIDYYSLGRKTGEMAYKILVEGASVTDMPVETSPEAVKMYNEEICAELGIIPPSDYVKLK